MEKVFQHFSDLIQGKAGLPFPLLRWMVPRWPRRPGSSKQQLLLLILFQKKVVKEALLRHGPVQLLQTAVGEELTQVHTIVHKEAHKIRLVINQCIHHHLFKVTGLEREQGCYISDFFFFVLPLFQLTALLPGPPTAEELVIKPLSYGCKYRAFQHNLTHISLLFNVCVF